MAGRRHDLSGPRLVKPPKGERLSPEERADILTLYSEGVKISAIAAKLHRNQSVISRFVSNYASTTKQARMRIEAGAEKLAQRIVKSANVEESLEVMDRLDVLARKERSKQVTGPSFNLIIGMPGAPALPPAVPSLPPAIEVEAHPVPPAPLPQVSPIPILGEGDA